MRRAAAGTHGMGNNEVTLRPENDAARWPELSSLRALWVSVSIVCLCAPLAAWAGSGPSFSCVPPPLDAVANLACHDDRLATADARMVQAYYALRGMLDGPALNSLRSEFLGYMVDVRRHCGLPPVEPNRNQIVIPVPSDAAECVAAAYDIERSAWIARLSGPAAEEANRTPERNRDIQTQLHALGYLSTTTRIDGVFGAGTRAAVRAWQHVKGRPETGFLGDADATQLAAPATNVQPPDPVANLTVKPLAGPTEYDGKEVVLASGKLEVRLAEDIVTDTTVCNDKQSDFLGIEGTPYVDACHAIDVTITVDGQRVASGPVLIVGKDDDVQSAHVSARIIQLDPAAAQPQVLFTGYTGGAHCCTTVAVGRWKVAFYVSGIYRR